MVQVVHPGVDAALRRPQRVELGLGFAQLLLEPVQRGKGVLDGIDPPEQRRHVAMDVLEAIGEIVLPVVGLDVRQGPLELTLTILSSVKTGSTARRSAATLPTVSRRSCWRRRISAG